MHIIVLKIVAYMDSHVFSGLAVSCVIAMHVTLDPSSEVLTHTASG